MLCTRQHLCVKSALMAPKLPIVKSMDDAASSAGHRASLTACRVRVQNGRTVTYVTAFEWKF